MIYSQPRFAKYKEAQAWFDSLHAGDVLIDTYSVIVTLASDPYIISSGDAELDNHVIESVEFGSFRLWIHVWHLRLYVSLRQRQTHENVIWTSGGVLI